MPVPDTILRPGGYGRVGGVVAARLAERYPEKGIAAGRRSKKAASLAKTPGRVRPLALNLDDPKELAFALENVKVVVACVERADDLLTQACSCRIHNLDVSASYTSHRRVLLLTTLARRQGAAAIIGSGLIPGCPTSWQPILLKALLTSYSSMPIFSMFSR